MSFNNHDHIEMTFERMYQDGKVFRDMAVILPLDYKFTSYGVEWSVARRTTILIPWTRVVSITQVDRRGVQYG